MNWQLIAFGAFAATCPKNETRESHTVFFKSYYSSTAGSHEESRRSSKEGTAFRLRDQENKKDKRELSTENWTILCDIFWTETDN